jgi:hypothetical protein
MKTITLTEKQADTLEAYCESIDLTLSGIWPAIEREMRDKGFDNPDEALEDARRVLRGETS